MKHIPWTKEDLEIISRLSTWQMLIHDVEATVRTHNARVRHLRTRGNWDGGSHLIDYNAPSQRRND